MRLLWWPVSLLLGAMVFLRGECAGPEPPVVKVTHKVIHEGLETLLCQAYGFYPKEINATWTKDGEVTEKDTFHGVVSPNPDGTYYTWLSINIDPKDRNRFQCHVEHDGLLEPLEVAVEESDSSSHSLRYFVTGVSEPGPGLPWFIVAGYVDDQRIVRYDSNGRRAMAGAPWMEKAGEEDPRYWEKHTKNMQGWEVAFRASLKNLRERKDEGVHTWQLLYGCELSEDRPNTGYLRYAYDGRDFIAFDKKTLTWTAAVESAKETKRSWEADPAISRGYKAFLEITCIDWLWKYLDYGRESLLRKEPPVVKVTHKVIHEGLDTLLCQAYGFYPKEINATWRKDGEVTEKDTFHGVVSPNPDGTYYTWLSINIDPKDRNRFRCHVEHDGLLEPLDVAMEETEKYPEKVVYKAASVSDQGSGSSV